MNIFDIFKYIFTKKLLTVEEINKYYDIYMINYLFSFHERYLPLSNLLNKYTYKDKKQCYLFYNYSIDKGGYPFANIRKKKKDEFDEEKLKLAKMYLPEMSNDKIKDNWVFIGNIWR